MAFIIKDKQPGGHTGKISTGQVGEAVEIWTVIADDVTYTTEDVRISGIFPPVYDSFHPQNSLLRLMPIDIQQSEENPSLFTCTLTYSSDKLDPADKEDEPNPLDRKAHITVRTGYEKETKHRDFYGKPKVNAAGDLFDPPIESNRTFRIIVIRKNVTIFPDWIWEFDDAVNSQPFVIKGRRIDTGCAWMADMELGEEQEENNVKFCEARLEIHVKKRRKPVASRETEADVPNPWDTEQLNEGLVQLVATGELAGPGNPNYAEGSPIYERQRIKILDSDGVTLINAPAPVPLTPSGAVLNPVTIDNANFIVFRDHEYLDFNRIAYLWSNR